MQKRSSFLRRAAALLLVLAALGLPVVRANAQMVDALNRAYKRATEDFKELGLDNTKDPATGAYIFSIRGAWLVKGQAKISNPSLTPGVKYAIIAAGNQHIKKLSLTILGAQKKTLTESSEDSNAPGCNVYLDPKQYGTKPYTIGVQMLIEDMVDEAEKEDGWVCYMILRENSGWDVPLEVFEQASKNFQERLDAVQAASPGGASIAFDSIPLQGCVLPPGGTAAVNGTAKAGQKYTLIAAGDDNTDSLSVSVGGLIKVPTAEQQGTGKQTLKFTTDSRVGANFNIGWGWSVKNTGKENAVILTAAVVIITAG